MGDSSQKKTGNGVSRDAKGSIRGSLSRTADSKDHNVRLCSRIGCSGRLNQNRGSNATNSDEQKSARPNRGSNATNSDERKSVRPNRESSATNSGERKSVRPNRGRSATNSGERKSVRSTLLPLSNGKEVNGGSSSSLAAVTSPRRPLLEQRKKLPLKLEIDSPESSSSAQDNPQVLGKSQRDVPSESRSSRSIGSVSVEVGTSAKSLHKTSSQKSVLGSSNFLTGSPSASTKQGTHLNGSKSSLRNIRSNSTPDTVPSAVPPSQSRLSKKDSVTTIVDREGSSSLRKKRIGGFSREGYNDSSTNSTSISESRRVRHVSTNRKGGTPVRTSTSASRIQRGRIGNQGSGKNSAPNDSRAATSVISQPGTSCDPNLPRSSRQFSGETFLRPSVSNNLPGSSCGRSLLSQESFRQDNTDRIFEALLALGIIDQYEELPYEQLLDLETSLLRNGLNLFDQHREMRMDIDNMTYEELLALEEKMGNVSTALKEEELSKCLKTNIYQVESLDNSTADLDGDEHDVKCCICLEEFKDGDELGTLLCKHRYHASCIREWFRLKNWCPFCKKSAAGPSSS